MQYIGMDIHKNYSSVAVTDEQGDLVDCPPDKGFTLPFGPASH